MITSAPGVSKSDLLSAKIEATISAWVRKFPQEVADFELHMKRLRDERSRDQASRLGTQAAMSTFGEIPVRLHGAICMAIGSQHWHHDPATRKTFWSLFTMGKIRRGARLPGHE
jgi:hypothetical protein